MRRSALLVVGLCSLFLVGEAWAGGFGRSLFKRMKRNVKRKAKSRVTNTKQAVKDRVIGAKDNVITNATGSDLGQVASGGFSKDTLKQSLRTKVSERVATKSSLAATAIDGGDAKAAFKDSIRARVDEMKANVSKEALTERVMDNVVGEVPEGLEGVTSGGDGFKDSFRARIEALKAEREARLFDKVDGATGFIDDIGGSSGELDLNSSGAEAFSAVEGISGEDAQKIVDYRDGKGGAMETSDLIEAVGFKKYLLLRTYLGSEGEDEEEDYEEEEYEEETYEEEE